MWNKEQSVLNLRDVNLRGQILVGKNLTIQLFELKEYFSQKCN